MSITTLVLIVYLAILLLIAFSSFSKINDHVDFFIARKKGNIFTITGSLVATILGGSAIIGTIDEGPLIGWATSWYMLCASLGLLALIPLTSRVNRSGKFTLPELLGDLFDSKAKLISSVIIPVAWIGIIAAQIIAAARIIQSFTGINYNTGVVISGLVFIFYTIAGGQISVLKTDFFQAILIVTGLVIVAFFAFKSRCNTISSLTNLGLPFNIHFSPIDLLVLIITYSSTFTTGPDIFSRIFCAKNESTARKSVFIAAIILIPVALIIGFISVYGSNCIPVVHKGSLLIEVCKDVLPTWGVAIITVSLLSAVLSSADTTILSTSIILTELFEKGDFGLKTLKKSRIMILLVGITSILIALSFSSIIGILLIALTAYSGAFIIPIIAGLTGAKVVPERVTPAMITGGVVALAGKIIFYSGLTGAGNAVIISSFVLNGIILFSKKKPR